MTRQELVIEAVMAEAAYCMELIGLLKGDTNASPQAAQTYRKASKRLMEELGYSQDEIERTLFSDEKFARNFVFTS